MPPTGAGCRRRTHYRLLAVQQHCRWISTFCGRFGQPQNRGSEAVCTERDPLMRRNRSAWRIGTSRGVGRCLRGRGRRANPILRAVSRRNNGSSRSRTIRPSCRKVCRSFRNLLRSTIRFYRVRTMLRCLFLRFFGQLFPTTQQCSDAVHRFLCEQRKSSACPSNVGVKPPSQDGLQSWPPNAHDPMMGRIRCHQRL